MIRAKIENFLITTFTSILLIVGMIMVCLFFISAVAPTADLLKKMQRPMSIDEIDIELQAGKMTEEEFNDKLDRWTEWTLNNSVINREVLVMGWLTAIGVIANILLIPGLLMIITGKVLSFRNAPN